MKILLAVDGSQYTKKMLAYLVTHIEIFSASNEFVLINVQAAIPPRARSVVGKETVEKYYSEEAEKVLTPVAKFLLRHGINAKSGWKTGHAGEQISKACTTGGFDLLLMGSHGHGTLANMVMGSVATQVLANCSVPVLLVR
jgi:nucleotide-binding universal stress UspA family protein